MIKIPMLFVDDEPEVLASLALLLGRFYEVHTESNGEAGLAWLARHPDVAVIVSDMRMPGMNGATFLSRCRTVAPDATRVLLTGQADTESSIAVVNEGQIFRFLTKPCPPELMFAAMKAAAEQHRLVTAERVLLTQTLHGCVQALTEVLSLASPKAFGRANRLKAMVAKIAGHLGLEERWQVEMAAMLSQIGLITLPPATLDTLYDGGVLTEADRRVVEDAPRVTAQLLAHVPRLDDVRAILQIYWPPRAADAAAKTASPTVVRSAQVLRAAVEFDMLEARGNSPSAALEAMRSHAYDFDAAALDALATLFVADRRHVAVTDVAISGLQVGMTLHRDVLLKNGTLFVARGYTVTPSFVERIRNLPKGVVVEPLSVVLPEPPAIERAA